MMGRDFPFNTPLMNSKEGLVREIKGFTFRHKLMAEPTTYYFNLKSLLEEEGRSDFLVMVKRLDLQMINPTKRYQCVYEAIQENEELLLSNLKSQKVKRLTSVGVYSKEPELSDLDTSGMNPKACFGALFDSRTSRCYSCDKDTREQCEMVFKNREDIRTKQKIEEIRAKRQSTMKDKGYDSDDVNVDDVVDAVSYAINSAGKSIKKEKPKKKTDLKKKIGTRKLL